MDAYRGLQVAPECEDEVIHGAYRALAKKYHPDRDTTQFAARRMAELNQAYELVRDPTRRARHDVAQRRAAIPTASASFETSPIPPPRSSGGYTGLPILSPTARVVIQLQAGITSSSILTEVKVNSQEATA